MSQSASNSIRCLNCGTSCADFFCPQCGQSTQTRILDWKFLWNDLRFLLFSYDQSILLTLHELLTRPGSFIREFMDGKRVKRFHPLRLTLTLAGVYLAIHSFQPLVDTEGLEPEAKFAAWLLSVFPWFALVQIPMMAVSTYVTFRPATWTLAEHMGLSGYLVSQHLLLRTCGLLLSLGFTALTQLDTRWVWFGITEGASAIYAIITLSTLFTQISKRQRVLRTFLSLLLFLGLSFTVIGIAGFFWTRHYQM